jgi:radical SAM superfamily enzyme YgiQ (UPF0313 family)
MRIVFINPIELPDGIFGVDKYPPIGLMIVADEYIKKGWQVDLWDGQTQPRETLDNLISIHNKPDMVGITVMVGQPLRTATELSKKYIDLGIPVTWGGAITRTTPYLIPEGIQIDNKYHDGKVHWELIEPKNYVPAIYTSVGCPYRCSFCYHNKDQKLTFIHADKVIEEMEFLRAQYGIKAFKIMDDNFFTDKNRAIEILEAMRLRGMKVSQVHSHINTLTDEVLSHCKGVVGKIGISIEHGDAEVRKELFNKPMEFDRVKEIVRILKGYGIRTIHNFIFGSPAWQLDMDNFTAMREIRTINPKARGVGFGYVSMPETPLTKMIEEQYGEFPKTIEFWSNFDMETIHTKYSPWLNEKEAKNLNGVVQLFNKEFNL